MQKYSSWIYIHPSWACQADESWFLSPTDLQQYAPKAKSFHREMCKWKKVLLLLRRFVFHGDHFQVGKVNIFLDTERNVKQPAVLNQTFIVVTFEK
jgi:hypothetical protein